MRCYVFLSGKSCSCDFFVMSLYFYNNIQIYSSLTSYEYLVFKYWTVNLFNLHMKCQIFIQIVLHQLVVFLFTNTMYFRQHILLYTTQCHTKILVDFTREIQGNTLKSHLQTEYYHTLVSCMQVVATFHQSCIIMYNISSLKYNLLLK